MIFEEFRRKMILVVGSFTLFVISMRIIISRNRKD